MSEIGIFWLLLPLAAASGWYIQGRTRRSRNSRQLNQFTTSYFQGLNYLLNEQPDKAIEVFLKIAEVDRDTVETHLALGNLFRRRGEVDRAIRFHQNLVSRQGLNPEQRTQALLELGEDYMRAGLLDRAERLFSELTQMDDHKPSALRHLVAIYQQEKDWTKSIEHAQRLQKVSREDMGPVIAQFYCEMAKNAEEAGDRDAARELLAKALDTDPNCVRASILEGRLAAEEGDHDAAIAAYKRVGEQDLDFIPVILESTLACYRETGNLEQAREFLQDVIERYRGISPVIALAEQIQQTEGRKAAEQFISAQLRRRPSVRGLAHLIGVNLTDSTGAARENLLILQDLTSKLMEGKPVYRCNQCGFGTRSLHWQCPSCKSWNSVKPIHGVAGE
ncbi:MAG: lipopolysaccharide assembly protein LapB [Xanthomonadales bacterium]|nr:lipopolysaccharide assembly protein LapB [Xanthomonadales bacterium]